MFDKKKYNKDYHKKDYEKNKESIDKVNKKYYAEHKEEQTEYKRNWYLKNQERRKLRASEIYHSKGISVKRQNNLMANYNLSLEGYNKLFQVQSGCCAICKRHQSEFKKALCVDHDHKTGKIRGLLCQKCNQGLGLFNDNVLLLREAILFLEITNKGE
jgi:hypothetical protein